MPVTMRWNGGIRQKIFVDKRLRQEKIRNFDLGLGTQLSFGLSEHQASHKVWGTQLDKTGHYQAIDLE